jgi:hypothetical protein
MTPREDTALGFGVLLVAVLLLVYGALHPRCQVL